MQIDPNIAKELPFSVLIVVYTVAISGGFFAALKYTIDKFTVLMEKNDEMWALRIQSLTDVITSLANRFAIHDDRTDRIGLDLASIKGKK